jgi:cholesterol oxidase
MNVTQSEQQQFDTDWAVIGSGFGGSVSALRLAEKGYRVTVFEQGRRFRDRDHARTAWNLRRYFWWPALGMRGIFRLTLFRDVFVASGCGVGGGSLGYANTLWRPEADAFYDDPQWSGLAKWREELAPHFDTAERMLGATEYPHIGRVDRFIQRLGDGLNVGDTFRSARVGVFMGEPGVEVEDPYFGGEGPRRMGCQLCGTCMLGCRHNAKNTLVKNYLYLAERRQVAIRPERQVVDIRPLGNGSGEDGFEVVTVHPGAWFRRRRATIRTRGVVVAAGCLGTNELLQRCRMQGSLEKLSDRLGTFVRTNSENILAITARDRSADFSKTVSISSSIYPDDHTHIEPVVYGRGGDAINFLATVLTPNGSRVTRPLKLLGQIIRHPLQFLRISWPFGWSKRTVMLLVMQSHDNAIRLVARRRWLRAGVKLNTRQDSTRPLPTHIPIAERAARVAAELLDGIPQSGVTEALFNVPTTAHIIGGAPIADSAEHGVVDHRLRAFGYSNLLVCDGSTIPANLGVNPSLTITALAERAMSFVPEVAHG